jgi:hypothetical protein
MRLPLLAVLLLAGLPACVTTTYHQLRPSVYGPQAAVEIYCSKASEEVEVATPSLQAAYAKGWRLAALGQTVTSFLGLVLSSEPVFCVERVK